MKKIKKIMPTLLVLTFILAANMQAWAGNGAVRQQLVLPANQIWVEAGNDENQGADSYVEAECHSVYPSSGLDTFRRVQCQIHSYDYTVISANSNGYDVLVEGNGPKNIELKQGYQNCHAFFYFRGNTSTAVNAIVSYDGTG